MHMWIFCLALMSPKTIDHEKTDHNIDRRLILFFLC
jgi:hypothetical protein